MPTPAYLTIEGETQGPISQGAFTLESVGNNYQEGHEDEIFIQAFDHQVTLPKDPQSGQPSGQRVHRPFIITKVFDKSSPLLFNSLVQGERLTKCELKWYRPTTAGGSEHYFTIALEDAIITDIQSNMPHCQDPANAPFTHLETVSLSYRKIEWTHEVAGTSASDDWRAPVQA